VVTNDSGTNSLNVGLAGQSLRLAPSESLSVWFRTNVVSLGSAAAVDYRFWAFN